MVGTPDIRPHSPRHSDSKKLLQEGGRLHTRSGKRISRHAEAAQVVVAEARDLPYGRARLKRRRVC